MFIVLDERPASLHRNFFQQLNFSLLVFFTCDNPNNGRIEEQPQDQDQDVKKDEWCLLSSIEYDLVAFIEKFVQVGREVGCREVSQRRIIEIIKKSGIFLEHTESCNVVAG